MQTVPIEAISNQELSIQLDGTRYVLTIKELDPGMCMVSVERDSVMLVSNVRAVSGFAILRYNYLQTGYGNFAFVTENGDYPYWEKFNVSQTLIYASDAEIEALNNAT